MSLPGCSEAMVSGHMDHGAHLEQELLAFSWSGGMNSPSRQFRFLPSVSLLHGPVHGRWNQFTKSGSSLWKAGLTPGQWVQPQKMGFSRSDMPWLGTNLRGRQSGGGRPGSTWDQHPPSHCRDPWSLSEQPLPTWGLEPVRVFLQVSGQNQGPGNQYLVSDTTAGDVVGPDLLR